MADQSKQAEIAERLQIKLLERFERMLDAEMADEEGILGPAMSPTDAATLARLLSQNGWTFDESRLPKNLRDRLTKQVDFDAPELKAM